MLDNKLIGRLQKLGARLAVAESCTGGGILKVLTEIPGASTSIWGGVVAYSDDIKINILNVSPELLEREGGVSSETAIAMAWGIKKLSNADWTIGVTGIAGPGGGTPEKPVGTVWIAWIGPVSNSDKCINVEKYMLSGNRNEIREQAIDKALSGLWYRLEENSPVKV